MSNYQKILYDYACPTWRWEDPNNKTSDKKLRWFKDEAFANSKFKHTYFNTRRAFIQNRSLDTNLERNISYLSKYHGCKCALLDHDQVAVEKKFQTLRRQKESIRRQKLLVDGMMGSSRNGSKLKKLRTPAPDSTKYYIHRHYHDPEQDPMGTHGMGYDKYRTVGKVDLLQVKVRPDNSLRTPKPIMSTKFS